MDAIVERVEKAGGGSDMFQKLFKKEVVDKVSDEPEMLTKVYWLLKD